MQPAVRVQGLSKVYKIGARPSGSLGDALMGFARAPRAAVRGRLQSSQAPMLEALSDINFEIARGEAVAFIGHNGAGKSTLLKILSRIVEPTRGRIELRGRVGSLLEVGTGFHPDLTGRENIFLNGAVLGMHRHEIAARFDEIVAFAETERFLDTPVKRYSSGMYMRLAFAVAAHLEPEILIVDEVLAVGDVAFQKKCIGKIRDVARHGRTVLFVSHNMQAVARLCSRAFLLDAGRLTFEGTAQEAIAAYHRKLQSRGTERAYAEDDSDRRVALRSVAIRQGDEPSGSFQTHVPLEVTLEVKVDPLASFHGLVVGFTVYNDEQVAVFSTYYDDLETRPPGQVVPGHYRFVCTIPANSMQAGEHRVVPDVGIANTGTQVGGDEKQVEFAMNNVRGIGSRWGLIGWRTSSAMLPYIPWEIRTDSGAPLPLSAVER